MTPIYTSGHYVPYEYTEPYLRYTMFAKIWTSSRNENPIETMSMSSELTIQIFKVSKWLIEVLMVFSNS